MTKESCNNLWRIISRVRVILVSALVASFLIAACLVPSAAESSERGGLIREMLMERREARQRDAAQTAPEGLSQYVLRHGGIDRTYYLALPAHAETLPMPLVLAFHGGQGSGAGVARTSDFHGLGGTQGFAVAYPEVASSQRVWNDGREEAATGIDDVGFVAALIEELTRQHNIDPSRIYATGLSNGGMFTYRLACELSDRIAAFAAVVANLPTDLEPRCAPGRPVPMLMIVGTEDSLMPYDGGLVAARAIRGGGRGQVMSAEATARFWRDHNRCSDTAGREVHRPERDANDGTSVTEQQWPVCANGSEVIQLTVVGGGHTWPGTLEGPALQRAGRTSREMNASAEIVSFFRRHSR
jgi:polyhydroxybutyrate depolymerase